MKDFTLFYSQNFSSIHQSPILTSDIVKKERLILNKLRSESIKNLYNRKHNVYLKLQNAYKNTICFCESLVFILLCKVHGLTSLRLSAICQCPLLGSCNCAA
jgi:hypothetical protein